MNDAVEMRKWARWAGKGVCKSETAPLLMLDEAMAALSTTDRDLEVGGSTCTEQRVSYAIDGSYVLYSSY